MPIVFASDSLRNRATLKLVGSDFVSIYREEFEGSFSLLILHGMEAVKKIFAGALCGFVAEMSQKRGFATIN